MSRVIEVGGMPNAGKSSMVEILRSHLSAKGLDVFAPQEGSSVIREGRDESYLYNVRIAIYNLDILLDSVQKDYDIVIFDRGLFDVYCWLNFKRNKDNQIGVDMVKKFILLPDWIDKIDICFMLLCEPEKIIQRERLIILDNEERGRKCCDSRFLTRFYTIYLRTIRTLQDRGYNIVTIDTTNKEPIEAARQVLSYL